MKKNIIIAISLVILFFGCSKKEELKPSTDSLLASEAISAIDAIKSAYQGKNKDILQNRLDALLAEDLLQQLQFETANLSFTPRMIKITESAVIVQMNWQGIWGIKGKEFKNRGVTDFVLEGRPMKLRQINGDNPFHIPPDRD